MHKRFLFFASILGLLIMPGCKKQNEWLDEKYNLSDVVPATVNDFQQLMDNPNLTTYGWFSILGADNLYALTPNWQSFIPHERNAYIWAQDIFELRVSNDWSDAYMRIMYANVVLKGLEKIERTAENQTGFDLAQGHALFVRACSYYELLQLFAKPYSSSTLNDLGIPLRTDPDINVPSIRATIGESYGRVISELKQAAGLLPAVGLNRYRPSRTAAEGMLARAYLNMENYDSALVYAGKVLNAQNALLDFNSLNATAFNPIPASSTNLNPEIIWIARMTTSSANTSIAGQSFVDSVLYNSYATDDLRKAIFYTPAAINVPHKFRGSYHAIAQFFSGLATNELYLIRAESAARKGQLTEAAADLNTLLVKRWRTGTYTNYVPGTQAALLQVILDERRKELPFTAQIRWEDLRRLNKDPLYAKTLQRVVNNQTYTLAPNSPRYVYPIPEAEIRLSGIQQNPR